MKILITGAAGYLGQLLVNNLSQNQNVDTIFALDRKPRPKTLIYNDKIKYMKLDLAKSEWEEKIPETPDIIIHFAFDIRSQYGKIKKQEFNNLFSAERILKYCFKNKVKNLIYSSSVSAYGAKAENIGKLLKEDSSLAENKYPYAVQKKMVEGLIIKMLSGEKKCATKICILRIASVNGPEGEKRKKLGLLKFIKCAFPILPITNISWTRQYLNEKDLVRAVQFLIFKDLPQKFDIFNLAPPDFMTMKDMASLLNKKTVAIPVWVIKPVLFLTWHLTLGLISTPLGSEKSFIYPINVDGSKITNLGFNYEYNSSETFLSKKING